MSKPPTNDLAAKFGGIWQRMLDASGELLPALENDPAVLQAMRDIDAALAAVSVESAAYREDPTPEGRKTLMAAHAWALSAVEKWHAAVKAFVSASTPN